MIKTLATTILALGLGVLPALAYDPVKLNDLVNTSTLHINSGCSGAIIASEPIVILTANHCVTKSYKNITEEEVDEDGVVSQVTRRITIPLEVSKMVYSSEGEPLYTTNYIADIISVDRTQDIAILSIRNEEFLTGMGVVPIVWRDYEYLRGEPVVAIGDPMGILDTVTTGVVSNPPREVTIPSLGFREALVLQHSANISGGNSGGALLNADLEMIGISVAGMRGHNQLNLAIPVNKIWDVLDKKCLSKAAGGVNPSKCKD